MQIQGIKIKKLNIRNSVKSIGVGCFAEAVISEEFKFSSQVFTIPKGAFESFECQPSLNFFNRLDIIESDAFKNCRNSAIPQTLTLYKVREIQDCAFQSTRNVTNIELFSTLDNLGEKIVDDCNDSLIVRCFTYVPLTSREETFSNLGENAKLVVPKGTKIIFENITPWSMFPNIEEWETDEDKNDKGKIIKVSDEIYCKRLHSLAESKRKVDRYFIKGAIEELAKAYLYVDSEEEYEEAMSLIAYNRSFSPAIVPELEKQLCREWTNKYKLRIIGDSLLNSYAYPLVLEGQDVIQPLPKPEVTALPLPKLIEIHSRNETDKPSSVIAYFNRDIIKQLQNNLTYARKSLKIAVSWFTNYSLFKQLKQMASDGIKIQLIINNDLINNGGYCLNLNELIDSGVELNLVEYPNLLHHKFVIIDDELLITGSYNWTRFSSKNYENIVVIKDEGVIEQFKDEFEELIENAEYKCIDMMPEYVKERPEYDRSAFKQYITEELDAQAKDSTDERDRITALKKAADLNPKYLEKINPGSQEKYHEAFKIVDNQICIQNAILNIVQQASAQQTKIKGRKTTSTKQVFSKSVQKVTAGKVLTRSQENIIESVKASDLIMCLDVSGSMSDTYANGHVHEITKKAIAAALALVDEKEVSIWTFGNDAKFEGRCGINQIERIYKITCRNEGTSLQKFIEKVNSFVTDGALCIIFTDDDSDSISAAVKGLSQREKVFWQIIAYESDLKNIKTSIKNVKNASIISLSDYQNITDNEINLLLLKDYIFWKQCHDDR